MLSTLMMVALLRSTRENWPPVYGDRSMLRWLLFPLLLLTTSVKVAFAGIARVPVGVNVKEYAVGVGDMGEMVCDAVATSVVMAPIVLRNVTVTVRLLFPDVPLRAINRVTLKLTLFSVSALCSGTFMVNVCDWLLPLMVMRLCVPVGWVRVRRCRVAPEVELLGRARAGNERRQNCHGRRGRRGIRAKGVGDRGLVVDHAHLGSRCRR